MPRTSIAVSLVFALLCGISRAHGQEATERFIPLGQSPGLSGLYTYVGRVEAVGADDRTLSVMGPAGLRTVRITEQTRIWLDRTKLGMTSETGSLADCQQGRSVEIKYDDPERKWVADWIKVQIDQPDP